MAVVDKPAGLVVHPGAGHDEGTLVGGLLSRFPDLADLVTAACARPDRPGIVHRLDKGTSGLLAVARTPDAYRSSGRPARGAFQERRYLALVAGIVKEDRGEVEAPIGRSARTPTKMAVTAAGSGPDGLPRDRAHGETGRRGTDDPARALPAERPDPPDPGAHGGHRPSRVGDARYGAADKRLGSGRFFLHAFKLAFTHPGTETRMEFASPSPTTSQAPPWRKTRLVA